jgi:hypothetical protein
MNEKNEFIEKINSEIEKRIEIMESPDYEGTPKFGRNDVFLSLGLVVICTFILIYAYNFLC